VVDDMNGLIGTAVVDDKEQPGLALRAGERAGFEDVGIFEMTADLERERCRLLGIRAAGKRQQYEQATNYSPKL